MRHVFNARLWLALAVVLTAGGCDDFLSVNDDPNNPTEAPASGLVTSATFETAQNHFRVADITSFYVQYLASPNPASDTDTQQPVSYGQTWFELYDVLTDLTDLEAQAAEQDGNSEALGIAKLLKAINLGLLADTWGSAPYSQAFLGEEDLQPAYDSGEALYEEIFTLIDDGIATLEQGEFVTTVGNEDFIYEGDTEAWIRLGYFLRARTLNHLSETDQYDPQAVLGALDAAFESTDDDAQVEYFEEEINPWADVAIDNDNLFLGGWLSEQIVGYLNGDTFGFVDPRIDLYTDPNDAGAYIGTQNGAGRGDAPEQGVRVVLTTDTYYAARTAPVLIATYFEQKFIEAEAAFRAGDTERAYGAYLDAITAQMTKIGVDEGEIQEYLSNDSVDPGSAGALTLDDVFQEKYVAMFLHPEAWVDARRHDYDYVGMEVPANLNPALGGQFIRRLAYPDSETQRNGANVPDVALSDRLWWDR